LNISTDKQDSRNMSEFSASSPRELCSNYGGQENNRKRAKDLNTEKWIDQGLTNEGKQAKTTHTKAQARTVTRITRPLS
jgi:hypothetical protein